MFTIERTTKALNKKIEEAINRASDILIYKCDWTFKITGAACI